MNESKHSLDFTLDGSLALDRQDLVQDLFHNLSWGTFGADAHQIGRDFEGVQLALQELGIHVVVFALLEAFLEHLARDLEQDEPDIKRWNLWGERIPVALFQGGATQDSAG